MMPLAHDMIGFICGRQQQPFPPTGERRGLLGTNSIAVAIPAEEEPPVVMDMAPTVTAFCKVRLQGSARRADAGRLDVDRAAIRSPMPTRREASAADRRLQGYALR